MGPKPAITEEEGEAGPATDLSCCRICAAAETSSEPRAAVHRIAVAGSFHHPAETSASVNLDVDL